MLWLWLILVAVYLLALVSWTLYWNIDLKNIRNALDLVAIKGALGVALGGFISAWMNLSEKKHWQSGAKVFRFASVAWGLCLALLAFWAYTIP